MNAGQYLVALSGLATGTAAAHLLAIQAGVGSGPGQTIFASQFVAVIETPAIEVFRKPKPAMSATVLRQPDVSRSKDLKGLYCTVSLSRLDAAVSTDEVVVGIRQHRTLFAQKADRKHYTKKGLT